MLDSLDFLSFELLGSVYCFSISIATFCFLKNYIIQMLLIFVWEIHIRFLISLSNSKPKALEFHQIKFLL